MINCYAGFAHAYLQCDAYRPECGRASEKLC